MSKKEMREYFSSINKKIKKSTKDSGINKLFTSINKQIKERPDQTVTDKDLDRVRSYIVSSAQPLQSIRLLQRQRKEREADEEYQKQLEEIIQKAAQIEDLTEEFIQKQNQMILDVENRKPKIKEYAQKTHNEQLKRIKEENEIASKQKELQALEERLLEYKEIEKIVTRGINKYDKCEKYLQSVVDSTDEFDKIENLMSRHSTLQKGENQLKEAISKLEKEQEAIKTVYYTEIAQVENEIMDTNNNIHNLQQKIDAIERSNMVLEANFEKNIADKCSQRENLSKAIFSINFLWQRARRQNVPKEDILEIQTEITIGKLINRLEIVKERIEDLQKLNKDKDFGPYTDELHFEAAIREEERLEKEAGLQLVKKGLIKYSPGKETTQNPPHKNTNLTDSTIKKTKTKPN